MNATQLANLKDFVFNRFPEKLVSTDYYRPHEQCGCIVGTMLVSEFGVDPLALKCNGEYVTSWYYQYEDELESADDPNDVVKENHTIWAEWLVERFGLTPEQFYRLQIVNDAAYRDSEGNDDRVLRAQEVKQYLVQLINRYESGEMPIAE